MGPKQRSLKTLKGEGKTMKTSPNSKKFLQSYARMWPRSVFYALDEKDSKNLIRDAEFLDQAGVYVLYRDDIPYYIGQASRLRQRLSAHACNPGGRYNNFWNYFSAFVITDRECRNQVEGILIASFPTANSAKPRIKKEKLPPAIRSFLNRQFRNPPGYR